MIHSQLLKSNWLLNIRKNNHVISVIVNSKKVKFEENVIAETTKMKFFFAPFFLVLIENQPYFYFIITSIDFYMFIDLSAL